MNIVLKAVVLAGAILFGGYAQKKWGIFDKAEGAAKSGCEKGKQCFDKFQKAEDASGRYTFKNTYRPESRTLV